jgi:hypothetical protein
MATRTTTGSGATGWGATDFAREQWLRDETAEEKARRPMREWALLVPERGEAIDFEHFPYQKEWYSDEVAGAREVVWKKAAQVGMSMYAWRWAARRSDQFADRVIYFFPTDIHVREFGDTRIEPSIRSSDYLLAQIPAGHVHQKGLKQIGPGFLSLRGLQSTAAVQSVDADAIVFDEYDLSDQKNLGQAERRIAGAKQAGREPRLRRLGYPTIPGYGIDAAYNSSDRRVWTVTCEECGEDQQIDFWVSLRWRNRGEEEVRSASADEFDSPDDVEEAWRACKECEASLEDAIYHGDWVPQNPGARTIGFHVPRLIVPRADLVEIVANFRKTKPTDVESFWTLDLGLAYTAAEASLSDEDLDRACSFGLPELPYQYTGRFDVTGGLDVASERDLSMVVDEHLPNGERRALYTGEPKTFEEAAEIMERYKIKMLAVDAMPERRQARALAATFPGRVVLVQYDEDNPRADAYRYDPKKGIVTVHRTEAIDAMMDSIRQARKHPPRNAPRNYYEQMKAPKRTTVEDTKGRPRRVYISTGTSGDDYAHAEVYALVGAEIWSQVGIIDEQMAGIRGTPLADEQVGFTRLDLGEATDEYRPGLEDFER